MKFSAYVGSFVLAAATLAIPAGAVAQVGVSVRIYDPIHKDYHPWDDREDRAYRAYWTDQHKDYREYKVLNKNEQRDYWKWRHNHLDKDEHFDRK